MKAKFLVPLLAVALLASCSNGGGATGGNGGNGGNGGTAKTGLIADYDLTGVQGKWTEGSPLDLKGDIKELFVNKVADGATLKSAIASETGIYKAEIGDSTPVGGIRFGYKACSLVITLDGSYVFDNAQLKVRGWDSASKGMGEYAFKVNGKEYKPTGDDQGYATVEFKSETDVNELTISLEPFTGEKAPKNRFFLCGLQLTNN